MIKSHSSCEWYKYNVIWKGTDLSYLIYYHNISQEFVSQITENSRQDLDFLSVTDTVPEVSNSSVTLRETPYFVSFHSLSGVQFIIFESSRLSFLRNALNRVILSKCKLLTTVKTTGYIVTWKQNSDSQIANEDHNLIQ
jgi:hypothetical protein